MQRLRTQYAYWHDWHYEFDKLRDNLAMWVAWHLPRRVVMWAYVRVGAEVSVTTFREKDVSAMGMMETLDAWGKPGK